MVSLSLTPAVRLTVRVFLLAAISVAIAPAWNQSPIRDGLTDDVISPTCRIGSLQSWQGQPCVISELGHLDLRMAGNRYG
jgi:hypothetical protein